MVGPFCTSCLHHCCFQHFTQAVLAYWYSFSMWTYAFFPTLRGFFPIVRFGLQHNKNLLLLYTVENRGADFAICSRYLQSITLHPPVPAFPICFCYAANIHDTKSGILAARKAFEKYPTIQRFCADAGYRKTFSAAEVVFTLCESMIA